MNKNKDNNKKIKNILIIGSGPIIIGQASEFDYSGTQAIIALKEEGFNVSLINNNPATIMTDNNIADNIHILPINCENIEKIIQEDKIDAILPNCGGQTALNTAIELHKKGILKKYNIELLGINLKTIEYSEDRLLFKKKMTEINEPVCNSIIINCKNKTQLNKCIQEAIEFSKINSFPIVIRPSFTLGGTGGGIAYNQKQLEELVKYGLELSPINEILLEQSIYGWKEIEYEIIRDANDTCICVCNMENFDPVGIHTGDSIVVAPTQTLNDKQVQMLRSSAIKIVRSLDIKGACNVQFGLHPTTNEYVVIEVNPRVSRSSALASKATSYPIARITAKISVGKLLNEIQNENSKISACLEPAVDYIVCKVPEFPFNKFYKVSHNLGTQMKSTGEYMGIGLTFEEAFLKCFNHKDLIKNIKKQLYKTNNELLKNIKIATDERIYQILSLIYKKENIDKISKITSINKWFLLRLQKLIDKKTIIKKYKCNGFRVIDGTANEFTAKTNYIFSTSYYKTNELKPLNKINKNKKTIIVVGSSAIKIGQGIEFDYSCVHAVKSLKKQGYNVVVVNNNPETVSTDYSLADRLYFEPIDADIIKKIYKFEKAIGVVIQFGGQTSLNIAKELKKDRIKIFGTKIKNIDKSEDRKKFYKITKKLKIKQPKSIYCSVKQVDRKIKKINFPVIVRPSYVIGGSRMKICKNIKQLNDYIYKFNKNEKIFIDEFIEGKEAEIDMVADKYGNVFIPLIAEHIEPAGIHSGDSNVLYPSRTLTNEQKKIMINYATFIAKKLKVIGLMNIQFVVKDNNIYVIEANLRSSRTIPTINKVCDIDLVDIAINAILGKKIVIPKFKVKKARKEPIFSNYKITKDKVELGVEMKSTGEILWFDE